MSEYRLTLDIDFAGLSFRGSVEADLAGVSGPVVLDSLGLTVHEVTVNGRPAPCENRSEEESLVLPSVPAGTATVRIAFEGRVGPDTLTGLYRSRYGDRYILTTQCAMTEAHRIFPCLDRPDRKAPIRLTLRIPSDLDAIFNTVAESESRDGATKTLVFAPTPPMATYLLYLGIGQFDRHPGPPGRVRITTYTPPGRASEGAFAAEHAGRLLPAFEEYYGQPYPLPKLDLVAVPEFAWGAMENWGAISFREYRVLVGPSTPTWPRRLALTTLAHEIAHQWFGNLVTMQWWDDIWLNESFATFLEMKMVGRLDPGHGSLDDFLTFWTSRTLTSDSLSSTHPVTAEIGHPSEIAERFDTISYGKGASVLRMIEAYIGEDRFRTGVSDYLGRFRYGNATSRDLWDSLDRAAGEPVHALLGPWIERPGLPVLSVHREAPGLVVRQRRFQLTGPHSEEWWPVPLVVELNGETRRFRLEGPRLEIPLTEVRSLCFNPNAAGFFRVLYDRGLYELLRTSFAGWAPPDQWALLQDLGAFVVTGDVPIELYLQFVEAARGLTTYLPGHQVTQSLTSLYRIAGPHPALTPASTSFFRAQYERLGTQRRTDEPELDGVLRGDVAGALAEIDDEVGRILGAQFPDRASVDPDLRSVVSTAFSRTGGRAAHVALRQAAEEATSDSRKFEYSTALAWATDPSLVEATYRLLDEKVLNPAHVPMVVQAAAANPHGREATWEWIQRRLEPYGEETRGTGFSSYVLEYALPFVGLGRHAEVEAWVRSHPISDAQRGAANGLAVLGANEALRQRLQG